MNLLGLIVNGEEMEKKSKIIMFPQKSFSNIVVGGTVTIPVFIAPIWAGIPSEIPELGEDFDGEIEVPEEFVKHPNKTFAIRIKGDSMEPLLKDGDQVIADFSDMERSRSLGKVIVAYLDGNFTIKRLKIKKNKWYLVAENPSYPDIEIKAGMHFIVWGVVIGVNEIRRIE
jgi:DNA polymerase V